MRRGLAEKYEIRNTIHLDSVIPKTVGEKGKIIQNACLVFEMKPKNGKANLVIYFVTEFSKSRN